MKHLDGKSDAKTETEKNMFRYTEFPELSFMLEFNMGSYISLVHFFMYSYKAVR